MGGPESAGLDEDALSDHVQKDHIGGFEVAAPTEEEIMGLVVDNRQLCENNIRNWPGPVAARFWWHLVRDTATRGGVKTCSERGKELQAAMMDAIGVAVGMCSGMVVHT